MSGRVLIGTSGWNYRHWRGPFYPDGLKSKDWFDFYAQRLDSVEINNSFYNLPEASTWDRWREQAPGRFVYAVKASCYITHMKKLKDPADSLTKFLDAARRLKNHLGPILFQMPPRWKCNPERLGSFLKELPEDLRCAFEFRDQSWWNDEVYDLLERAGAAFCVYELAGEQTPKQITAPFVYIRLHGPGDRYEGSYDARALSGWAGAISSWRGQGHDVYCYFDNDQNGYAAANAVALHDMVA